MHRPPVRRRALRLGVLATACTAGVAAMAFGAAGDLSRVSLTSTGIQATLASASSAVSADGRYVVFASKDQLDQPPTGGKTQIYVRDRQTGVTVMASASAGGAAGNGDSAEGDTFNPAFDISADGRYVVFASTATNLVPNDANGTADVFRKDMVTRQVTLVSVNSAGQQANAAVFGDPSVSGDGNRVAFNDGQATNLFPNDPGNKSDVLLRDIAAGTTVPVSVNSQGQLANGTCERPTISADGRVVAFEAVLDTTNLFPNDNNNANDIMVRNIAAGTTVPADVATNGDVLGANIPDISGNGRYVVFQTGETLDPANDNTGQDVYRRDVVAGVTTLVSARNGLDGRGNGAAHTASISADGARVAFESESNNLTTVDNNAAQTDAFVRDVPARTTQLVSAQANGTQGGNASNQPEISGNGANVAFEYNDDTGVVNNDPLIPGDTNKVQDIFLKELAGANATAPTLALTAPADVSNVGSGVATVTVTGSASDPAGIASVTVNGAPATVAADGTFSMPAPLGAAGTSTAIAVVARNGAGVTTTLTRTVRRLPVSSGPSGGTESRPKLQASKATYAGGIVKITMGISTGVTGTAHLQVWRVQKLAHHKTRLLPMKRRFTRQVSNLTPVLLRVGRLPVGGYRLRISVTIPTRTLGTLNLPLTRLFTVKPVKRKAR